MKSVLKDNLNLSFVDTQANAVTLTPPTVQSRSLYYINIMFRPDPVSLLQFQLQHTVCAPAGSRCSWYWYHMIADSDTPFPPALLSGIYYSESDQIVHLEWDYVTTVGV
ncbi:hypothetical protein JOB18_027846 [Solea senegalensis]|uniref:Uncharacterized protein n=1 Tax=Solea senegalensis TaxID=28829 RepID=A0AAV6R1U1_SOLSE|nr:hypothetical protein JOB18_027846 [Solea senegalensis]